MKNVILTSSVLILAVILLRRMFAKRIPAKLQYALWLIVAVRLLLPVTLTQSELSILNLGTQIGVPATYAAIDRSGSPSGGDTADVPAVGPAPATARPEAQASQPGAATQIDPLVVVWAAGAIVVGGWYLYSNLKLLRALRRSRQYVGLAGKAPVYLCGNLSSPCVFGSFRPAIYLNRQVLADPQTARFALEHERRHIAHRDPLWTLVRTFCVAVYWFNPLVWAAAYLSRLDGELACDEAVVNRLGDDSRYIYGHALLEMAAGQPAALAACFSSKSSLPRRIERLAAHTRTAVSAVVVVLSCAVLLISCTFTAAQSPSYMTAPCVYYDAAYASSPDTTTQTEGAVTLAAWPGVDVVAAFDGTVQILNGYVYSAGGGAAAGSSPDRLFLTGKDGTVAIYYPVGDVCVSDGDKVKAGDRLGAVVANGRLTFALNASKDDTIQTLDPFHYLQPFALYQFGANTDEMISPLSASVSIPRDADSATLQAMAKKLERQLKAETLGSSVSTVWHNGINLSVFGEPASVRIYADASLQEDLLAQDGNSQYYAGLEGTAPIAVRLDTSLEEDFSLCDYSLYPASDAQEQSFFVLITWASGDSLLAAFKVKQS